MRLVACSGCHRQYDVSTVSARRFACSCGATVENRPQSGKDSEIHRCAACGALVEVDARACSYCGAAIVRDRRKLSLICPECYARNPKGSAFCTNCGVRFEPRQVIDLETKLNCPCCDFQMTGRVIGAVPAQECASCKGLWVPGNHFNELIQKAVDAYRERAQDPFLAPNQSARNQKKSTFSSKIVYRKCPVCSSSMSRRNFARKSGIIIDRCRRHGTWLDADELEDIATFVAQGGMRNTTVTVQQNVQSQLDDRQIQALLEKGRAAGGVEERPETVDRDGRKTIKRTIITHQHGPWGRIASLADFLSDLLD